MGWILTQEEIITHLELILPQILYLSFSSIALLVVNGSRFNRKTTALIIIPSTILLFLLNFFLLPLTEFGTSDLAPFITLFIPQALISIAIGKRKGIFAISSTANAFLAIYMGKLIETNVVHKFDYIYIRYIVYILCVPILLFFLKNFYVKLQNIVERSLPKMSYIFVLLSLAIITEVTLLRIMINTDSTTETRLDAFTLTILVIYVLVISAFYIILNAYSHEAVASRDRMMLEGAITALQDKIRIRDVKEKQLRILRHDMKHLLISLASLLNNNKLDEAKELIQSYTKVVENNSLTNYCKDPFINALLDYYVAACKISDIECDVKINNIEDVLDIPSTELSIFISNCFDNAIRASAKLEKENRHVSFTFLNNDGRLILQMKNNYNGKITLDENKKPTSIYDGHGIGTTSIEAFAKRYGIMLNYDINDHEFVVNALFSK